MSLFDTIPYKVKTNHGGSSSTAMLYEKISPVQIITVSGDSGTDYNKVPKGIFFTS